ncbi:hypothetical protein GGR50DRAFT_691246 [Xylaria sp. CBS 124048]|nr:hypothetical protein GGR50DRAFT_691246 [Xylaria sp. CBS 124048]
MSEVEENELFLGLALSDTDTDTDNDDEGAKKEKKPKPKQTQKERGGQSEAEFRDVQRTYTAKVENGEIWKTVSLPLDPAVAKPDAQTLLHAVEELYFFRRFAEAARFARAVIDDDGGAGKIDGDTLRTLRYYERRCGERVQGAEGGGGGGEMS